MSGVYLAWAAFVAAVAMHFIFWPLAGTAVRRKQIGLSGGPLAYLFWFNAAGLLALFLWPFLAAGTLDWNRDPTVFSVMLMTGGALVLAWLLSLGLQLILGTWLQGVGEEGSDSLRAMMALEFCIAWGTLVLTIVAYVAMNFAADPYR